jgi:hypothetical protein
MRYNFYSHIHRFMRSFLSDFERLTARTDFTNPIQLLELKNKFNELVDMLKMHAEHEDKAYHPIIKDKEPELFQAMENAHKALDENLLPLSDMLNDAVEASSEESKIERGYQFYLSCTQYISAYLMHLFEEESQLMPALQKHYTDIELRAITFNTYHKMTSKQMLEMLRRLFPYINLQEKQVFLDDIMMPYPDKFREIFPIILSEIADVNEKNKLAQRYK